MSLFELKSNIAVQRKLENLQILLEDRFADGKTNVESNTSPASSAVGSSVLPPMPSIFHGRQEVVDEIVKTISTQEPARVAVLGPGGVGKTSLSLIVLHHPTIVESFKSNRWFIQCEGSTTPQGLVSAIANRLELSGDKLFERIILSFEAHRTILVLDNFETPWETVETRSMIENFLSSLAAIQTLTLLVTMRGSERPFGTAWTRPFIPPLTTLDTPAARLTFVTISDTPEDDPHLGRLLKALDNFPLAITLMANLAQYETPEVLLRRWDLENTPMLNRGTDHHSSLEISIKISLDGPRMRQNPDATRLLRLLALLPQGSRDLDKIAPDIKNIHKAAAVLKQVGLAHVDGVGYLRVLAPIRRFIILNYPPDPDSWKPVQTYYENLAKLSSEIERGLDGKSIIEQLSSQTSNMQAVIEYSLDIDGANSHQVIRAAIDLTDLFRYTGLGSLTSLQKSAVKAECIGEKALLADCIRSQAEIHYSRSSRELATAGFEKARSLYRELGDQHLSEQGRCTMMLGMVEGQAGNYEDAIVHIEHAIELHRRDKDVVGEADCLVRLAQNAIAMQTYCVAIPCVNAAVTIYQTHTHLRGQARCMWLLGVISQERRIDYVDATEKVADAALAYRYLGDFTGKMSGRSIFITCLTY
jgi:tetratricopeptide (TPR) repeat protein